MAYESNETGRFEIYVRPFIEPDSTDRNRSAGKWQISSAGGSYPRWRRDGKELFYLAPEKTVMAVEVQPGSAFEAGAPKPLFHSQIRATDAGYQYDVSADGQRFLINTMVSEEGSAMTVVQNWTAGLKK